MRIISGCRRGHKLVGFEGQDIRPTTDRVKESLFNLIQEHVCGARVLDLFGGSGALALEAVSRGAACAVCTDISRAAVNIIRKNVASLGFDELVEVRNISAFDYLRGDIGKFDIILLDPPYNKGYMTEALSIIKERGLLSSDGIAVAESDSTDVPDPAGLEILKRRKYGRTYITVFGTGQ